MGHYIVVGSGLSGLAIAETLLREGQEVTVFDDGSQKASMVAGGLYNPVVLKSFNLTWEGRLLMETALPFYRHLEEKLGLHFDEKIPVLRLFASAGEQNKWFEATDLPGLSDYLSPELLPNTNTAIHAPYGFGQVLQTGRIHTSPLLRGYREYLEQTGSLRRERFSHQDLIARQEGLEYQGLRAVGIIFSEGFGLLSNPYFNYLPLDGNKGELLEVYAPDLRESRVIKGGVFLIPTGDDYYLAGATYNRKDDSPEPTIHARETLLKGLNKILMCDFKVTRQWAGIRPTVPDRRPLVGVHPQHPNVFVLNGMGSRGVLIAPYTASCLARFILKGISLPEGMDCVRYSDRFQNSEKDI
jgi:glycine/D-amino acid oxidase-like deaminating enzyme